MLVLSSSLRLFTTDSKAKQKAKTPAHALVAVNESKIPEHPPTALNQSLILQQNRSHMLKMYQQLLKEKYPVNVTLDQLKAKNLDFRQKTGNKNTAMKKSFLADNPVVCYEDVEEPKHYFALEEFLFKQKMITPLYYTSYITYGESCADRGYTFDKKPHPCYPDDIYTAFTNAVDQKAYREYRDKKYKKMGVDMNITEYMLTGCGKDV